MSNLSVQKSDSTEKFIVEYKPFGQVATIKLTPSIVQKYIAVPTKSGKTCSERDAVKFIALCKAQLLDPFAGDAYLVGYDTRDHANNVVAQFSLITAHQAFLKRAENATDYEGMESGICLLQEDGEVKDREGDFHLQKEFDNVVGGWARVYRNGRRPTYRRIRMARFNKGYAQWKEDAAGMICKCAESDALRSTFPSLLGGLRTEGEVIDITASVTESASTPPRSQLVDVRSDAVAPDADDVPMNFQAQAETRPEPERDRTTPTAATKPESGSPSPQSELETVVTSNAFDLTTLLKWGAETGNIPDADSITQFSEIKAADATRILKAKVRLIGDLAKIKKGAA